MAKIGLIGAGSWGTALSKLAADNGHEVTVWSIVKEEIEMLQENREHLDKLPGVKKIHLLPYHRLGQDKYTGLGRDYEMDGILPPDNAYMEMLRQVVQQNSSLYCQIGG